MLSHYPRGAVLRLRQSEIFGQDVSCKVGRFATSATRARIARPSSETDIGRPFFSTGGKKVSAYCAHLRDAECIPPRWAGVAEQKSVPMGDIIPGYARKATLGYPLYVASLSIFMSRYNTDHPFPPFSTNLLPHRRTRFYGYPFKFRSAQRARVRRSV